MSSKTRSEPAHPHMEDVELHGHIIDSLILPKVLDVITSRGGSFRIKQIAIGQERGDPSNALIQVQAASEERLRRDPAADLRSRRGAHRRRRTAAWWRPTSPARFPKGFTARPIRRPRFAWTGIGSKWPIRRWTAASSSIRGGARPAAWR